MHEFYRHVLRVGRIRTSTESKQATAFQKTKGHPAAQVRQWRRQIGKKGTRNGIPDSQPGSDKRSQIFLQVNQMLVISDYFYYRRNGSLQLPRYAQMKIAISGKGGVGKTTISGTLCRLLGRKGFEVLAIDGDPNPNLSVVLGISRDQQPKALKTDILERIEEDGKRRIQLGVPMAEVIDMYGIDAPDNVKLLTVGTPEHAGTGCMCGSHTAVREIIHAAVADSKKMTVLDMEASLEQMKRGTTRYVDAMYTVVEPYYRSLEAANRIHRLAKELGVEKVGAIANKVRTSEEKEAIQQFCERNELDLVAIVPYDEAIPAADLQGQSLLDTSEHSIAVDKIKELADQVLLSN